MSKLFPVLGCLLAMALSANASAADYPIAGQDLLVKPNGLKFTATSDTGFVLPTPGAPGDPTLPGSEQRVHIKDLDSGYVTYVDLQATDWKGIGNPAGSKGYKGKSHVCKVLLRANVIKVACKDFPAPNLPFVGDAHLYFRMQAVVSGPEIFRYCAQFGGTIASNDEKSFKAADAPAPDYCSGL